jgi:hypothetical protein
MKGSGLLPCLAFISREDLKRRPRRCNQVRVIEGKVVERRIALNTFAYLPLNNVVPFAKINRHLSARIVRFVGKEVKISREDVTEPVPSA